MDPRIGRRRAAVTRARGRRRLRALVTALALAVAAYGVFSVLHSSWLSARHLVVRGADHTPRLEVLSVAGVAGHPPLVDVNTAAAARRLDALPWVKTAVLSKAWPDTLRIDVVERQPVAAVAGTDSHQGRWALVDGSGRVLGYVGRAPALPTLVSPAAPGRAGRSLGAAARPALTVVAALPGQLPRAVRSVSVAADGVVTLTLVGGVEAELGPAVLVSAKLAALRSVLLGAPPSGPEIIDVTVPAEPTTAPIPS